TTASAPPRSRPGVLARVWRQRARLLKRLATWLFVAVFLLPIVWAVSASLKTRIELYSELPSLLSMHPTLANYQFNFQRMPEFFLQFRNSMVVALGAVAIQIFCSSLAGYAFARLRFPGRDLLFYTLVMLIFVPRAGGLMAQYEIMAFLGLRN